jgi:hypothetical protein
LILQVQLLLSASDMWEIEKYQFIAEKVSPFNTEVAASG